MEDVFESVLYAKNPSVLIYLTTPPSEHPAEAENSHLYEMDDPYPSALHTDLKRDLRRQSDSGNNLAIFETYQFLTPGTSCAGDCKQYVIFTDFALQVFSWVSQ